MGFSSLMHFESLLLTGNFNNKGQLQQKTIFYYSTKCVVNEFFHLKEKQCRISCESRRFKTCHVILEINACKMLLQSFLQNPKNLVIILYNFILCKCRSNSPKVKSSLLHSLINSIYQLADKLPNGKRLSVDTQRPVSLTSLTQLVLESKDSICSIIEENLLL